MPKFPWLRPGSEAPAGYIVAETSVHLNNDDVTSVVHRMGGDLSVEYAEVPQDKHLADNQSGVIRCGGSGYDNRGCCAV